jgi:molybdate/tungstate transport system permease protein
LLLTGVAMAIVVLVGTPVALYIARCSPRERMWWLAAFLLSILLPPLALGLLFSIAFGPHEPFGRWLLGLGVQTSNSATAFIATQVYVSAGFYIVGGVAALTAVPPALEVQAALLGHSPWRTFWAVTLPLAAPGLAAALSLAWVRALGEFGAVMVTAYYPASMPVALWTNLQNFGLPAVMPLLLFFIASALPLPWLFHLLAQRRAPADA